MSRSVVDNGPFEPGDYVAWQFGPVQYRGHVVKTYSEGEEVIVRSTSGVEWRLEGWQIDRLGSLETVEIRDIER
jgi:CRISPR/Cas system-associated protein Cas5 (RAMP superfamily)